MRFSLVLCSLALAACGSVRAAPDAAAPADGDGCVAESDSAFCARQSGACETVTANDDCGQSRTANCGACAGTDVCIDHRCRAPVCANLVFAAGTPLVSVNASSHEDALQAMTPTGSTLLLQRGMSSVGCAPFALFIADETAPGSGAYQLSDITQNMALALMPVSAEWMLTLSADGRTIIGPTQDRKRFLASTRSAPGMADFGAALGTDFAAVNATGTQNLSSPYISADGLAFYYVIDGDADTSRNGIYESIRSTIGTPFPAGVRMAAPVQDYAHVTATSSDRMALFVQNDSFTIFVLLRRSLSTAFTNPNAPNPPPMLPGWRTRPVSDCSKLIGTCNGGCGNEDVCVWNRM